MMCYLFNNFVIFEFMLLNQSLFMSCLGWLFNGVPEF